MTKLKILAFAGAYLPGYKGGGPIKTIKNLFEMTGGDIRYQLITADRDLGDIAPYRSIDTGSWNNIGDVSVFYTTEGPAGFSEIKNIVCGCSHNLIYLNSFFSFKYSIYPQLLARLTNQPVIIAPRGEFSFGALQLKSYKKKLFIFFYRLLGFHRKAIFQASSNYEVEDIKKTLGGDVDTQVAENIGAQEFARNIPVKKLKSLRIIFVSRISPMKNLLQAIEILKNVKSTVEYDIYGPIEDKYYWAKCQNAIKHLPSFIKVSYKGSLSPDQVIETMASYDMLFMPTLGENYGHVIAEAFCAGIPVLIADTTPWRELEEKGIGWDIPLDHPEKFAQAMNEFSTLSNDDYQAKRQKVLEWAKEKFSQRDAIESNIAMFKYAYKKVGSNNGI